MKYILFGAGRIGLDALRLIGKEHVLAFCDNYSHSDNIENIPVITADQLAKYIKEQIQVIITVSTTSRSRNILGITEQLESLGIPYITYDEYRIGRLEELIGTVHQVPLNHYIINRDRLTGLCYEWLKNDAIKHGLLKRKYERTGGYEDVIWWCWLQGGVEHAPEICKACFRSVKREMGSRKIIVIEEDNLNKYLSFPEYITDKYKSGLIGRAHYSDLVRLELLIQYGGTWIDSSAYITACTESIFTKPLFFFKNINGVNDEDNPLMMSNWFISSEKNNPVLMLVRDLLYHYWEHNDYVLHYFIFHLYFRIALEVYPEIWKDVPTYPNTPTFNLNNELFRKYTKTRYEQLKQQSCIHKLNWKSSRPGNIQGTFYEYILQN